MGNEKEAVRLSNEERLTVIEGIAAALTEAGFTAKPNSGVDKKFKKFFTHVYVKRASDGADLVSLAVGEKGFVNVKAWYAGSSAKERETIYGIAGATEGDYTDGNASPPGPGAMKFLGRLK